MAVYGYFSSLAAELSDRNIGVTICCPGPVSTGTDEAPRLVYGPTGLLQQPTASSSAKVRGGRGVGAWHGDGGQTCQDAYEGLGAGQGAEARVRAGWCGEDGG